ncbi:CBO0543 family protein [Sporobacter termitidis]|nr:CBO0543 family protein [Sporobacter termitidis]
MILAEITNPTELQFQLTNVRFDEWISDGFFHIRWVAMVSLFAFSAWLWWKMVNKERLAEVALNAAVTAVMILILDELGEEMTLWDYPIDVIPLFPPISAINLASLPFLYSLIYQFFGKWKSFLIAQAVMALFSCFVFEPLFVWLRMYQMLSWKSWYGLPLYFAIGIIAKAVLSAVKRRARKVPAAPFHEYH